MLLSDGGSSGQGAAFFFFFLIQAHDLGFDRRLVQLVPLVGLLLDLSVTSSELIDALVLRVVVLDIVERNRNALAVISSLALPRCGVEVAVDGRLGNVGSEIRSRFRLA